MSDRSLHLLDRSADPAQLAAAFTLVEAEDRLALDLEADSFHRYVERVCLIQVGTRAADLLFDPITHGLPDPLRALMASPERTWVLHGGDHDILTLKREFGLELGRVLDTQIAARFLGRVALGLQSLLESELGVRIGKGEQRSDWRRRPLSDAQVRYARQDVAHLMALADRLVAELDALGRRAWLEQECELLRRRAPVARAPDPDAWLKLKGTRELPEAGRAVVRAVHGWREAEAAHSDRAPFRVLAPDMIVQIARETLKRGAPRADDLRRWRGIAEHTDVAALASVIAAALAAPHTGRAPPRARSATPAVSADIRARVEMLRKARVSWAAPLSLDPALVLPPALIDAIAALPSPTAEVLQGLPGMTPWRYEVLGPSLLAALGSM